MTGEPEITLLAAAGLMMLGVAAQFVQKMAELEEAGQRMTPWGYLARHPWRSLNMVLASLILLYLWQALGELNTVTAILTGYACQSASETLRARAQTRINRESP